MTLKRSALKDKKEKLVSLAKLAKENTIEQSKVLNVKKTEQIDKARPRSPIRLTSIALMADLPAWILVCQKLMSK